MRNDWMPKDVFTIAFLRRLSYKPHITWFNEISANLNRISRIWYNKNYNNPSKKFHSQELIDVFKRILKRIHS